MNSSPDFFLIFPEFPGKNRFARPASDKNCQFRPEHSRFSVRKDLEKNA
jgi:hypothetical protein